MSFVLSLLASRVGAGATVALVVILLAFSGCQTVRLKGAQADLERAGARIDDLNGQLTRCQGNRAALEESIAKQNAQVEAFARQQAERIAAAEKAAQTAAKGRADAEARAAKLLKSQPQGVDACARFESADRSVLDSLR